MFQSNDEKSDSEDLSDEETQEKPTSKRYRLENNVKKTQVGCAMDTNGKFRYFCTHCTNSYPLSKNLIWHLWGKKGHRCLKFGNERYRWINPSIKYTTAKEEEKEEKLCGTNRFGHIHFL